MLECTLEAYGNRLKPAAFLHHSSETSAYIYPTTRSHISLPEAGLCTYAVVVVVMVVVVVSSMCVLHGSVLLTKREPDPKIIKLIATLKPDT